MSKFTLKEVKQIIKDTPTEIKGKSITDFDFVDVGTGKKSDANWSYHIKTINYNNELYNVAVVYGFIE